MRTVDIPSVRICAQSQLVSVSAEILLYPVNVCRNGTASRKSGKSPDGGFAAHGIIIAVATLNIERITGKRVYRRRLFQQP